MSRLAVDTDDHPEAAEKHLCDAQALLRAERHDGAAYLAGYVVECSLKTHVLLAQATVAGKVDQKRLREWHQTLRKGFFGHNLLNLLHETTTPNSARYWSSATYRLGISDDSTLVLEWSESMRYSPASASCDTASNFVATAETVYRSILRMKLDGVL